jgi:hypothetical protein
VMLRSDLEMLMRSSLVILKSGLVMLRFSDIESQSIRPLENTKVKSPGSLKCVHMYFRIQMLSMSLL